MSQTTSQILKLTPLSNVPEFREKQAISCSQQSPYLLVIKNSIIYGPFSFSEFPLDESADSQDDNQAGGAVDEADGVVNDSTARIIEVEIGDEFDDLKDGIYRMALVGSTYQELLEES